MESSTKKWTEDFSYLFRDILVFIPTKGLPEPEIFNANSRLIIYVTLGMTYLYGPRWLAVGAIWLTLYAWRTKDKVESFYRAPPMTTKEVAGTVQPETEVKTENRFAKATDEPFPGAFTNAQRMMVNPRENGGRGAIVSTAADYKYKMRPTMVNEETPTYMDGNVGRFKTNFRRFG